MSSTKKTTDFTPEELEAMMQFFRKIQKEITTSPYPIKWFISVHLPNEQSHYFSNMCPVCASEDIADWIEEEGIEHTSNETDEKVH